jgi:hypothetical protein
VEPPLWWINQLNQPISIIALLGVTLFLFLTMNPVVGLLFMIYVYELLRQTMSVDQKRNDELARMNPRSAMSVEEYVIEQSDYSKIKNQNENNDTQGSPTIHVDNNPNGGVDLNIRTWDLNRYDWTLLCSPYTQGPFTGKTTVQPVIAL